MGNLSRGQVVSKEVCMEFETLWERLKQKAREKMPDHLHRLNFTRDERIEYQQKALAHLLVYVKKHTPYYQESLKEINVENFKLADIAKLPVTTTDIFLQDFPKRWLSRIIYR